jgi:branched-chain amino acid transport system permease protein
VKFSIDRQSKKVILLFLFLILLCVLPLVVTNYYWQHLLIMSLITSVLGMTFSMIFCCAGMVTLGIGAFIAIGSYASTMLVVKLGLSFWLAMPLSVVITALFSFLFGLVAIRNPGVAFCLLTMIFAQIVTEITGQINFFGGWGGFIMIPRPNPIGPVKFIGKLPFYYLIVSLCLLVVCTFSALYSSRIGRVWKAISLSPHLAQTLGINVYRYRLLAFVIASSAAGLAGSFYAHYAQTLAPATFGGFFSILVQLYPILGGINYYILGPAIGATIMTIVPEFLRITKDIEPIITGMLVLIIVLFFPGGILGSLTKFPHLDRTNLSKRWNEIENWISKIRSGG